MRRPLRFLLFCLLAAVVLIVGGVAFYLAVLRDDPPARVALPDEPADPAPDTGGDVPASAEGVWTVLPGEGSFVGYRVSETFANLSVASDAVGRSDEVTGSLTVADQSVTAATVTADVSALESDEERRDQAIKGRGLETDRFPDATFVLDGPLALPRTPERGVDLAVTATGQLTLHGVTRTVEVPVQARWSGPTIEVVGTIPVDFADYSIEAPTVGGFVSVEDRGEIELQLTFNPA